MQEVLQKNDYTDFFGKKTAKPAKMGDFRSLRKWLHYFLLLPVSATLAISAIKTSKEKPRRL